MKTIDPRSLKLEERDYIRISEYHEAFYKGYTPNRSNEIFSIKKVKLTNPSTYTLEDKNNSEIEGSFYAEGLQKVKNPIVYLLERVISRKGIKAFVKWFGIDKKTNSWIFKKYVL